MALSVIYAVMDGTILGEIRSGVERDYVPETIGSTAALVDSVQVLTDTYEYWPYGEVAVSSGTATTPFKFCGTLGYFFASSYGYVRNRFYRSDIAQWMSVDRKWPDQPAYRYCQGQPTMMVDPTGDDCWDDWVSFAINCVRWSLILLAALAILAAILAGIACTLICVAGPQIEAFPVCFVACWLGAFLDLMLFMLVMVAAFLAFCLLVDAYYYAVCQGYLPPFPPDWPFTHTVVDYVFAVNTPGPLEKKKPRPKGQQREQSCKGKSCLSQ